MQGGEKIWWILEMDLLFQVNLDKRLITCRFYFFKSTRKRRRFRLRKISKSQSSALCLSSFLLLAWNPHGTIPVLPVLFPKNVLKISNQQNERKCSKQSYKTTLFQLSSHKTEHRTRAALALGSCMSCTNRSAQCRLRVPIYRIFVSCLVKIVSTLSNFRTCFFLKFTAIAT